jgi:hypothetical protein
MPKPPQEKRMVKCPFTGKMVPFVPRAVAAPMDIIDTPLSKLPDEVKKPRIEEVTFELAKLRSKFVDIGPSKRCGATGQKMSTAYRKLSLEYWHLTGNHPPKIDADL